ncbi:hypothetical protein R5R35_009320 [Gryllus longicercus]|uniref:Uncharacterized protein n=1 Tax=Gryllus longicercus TaxID=2509291 RepID=A0AAN9WC09_9ORTH
MIVTSFGQRFNLVDLFYILYCSESKKNRFVLGCQVDHLSSTNNDKQLKYLLMQIFYLYKNIKSFEQLTTKLTPHSMGLLVKSPFETPNFFLSFSSCRWLLEDP